MSEGKAALQEKRQNFINELRGQLTVVDEDGIMTEAAQTRAKELRGKIEALNSQIEIYDQSRTFDKTIGAYRPDPKTPHDEDRENQAIGMNKRDLQQYQIRRHLLAMGDMHKFGDRAWEMHGAELERDVQKDMEARAAEKGREVRGALIPADIMVGSEKRDLLAGAANAGNELVPDILATPIIELLRANMILTRAGAQTLSGLSGDIYIARQTGGATVQWVNEGGSIGESTAALDQVPLKPKAIGAYTEYSRRLLLQSAIDVERFIRNDLVSSMARGIEQAAFQGTGTSNQPEGVEVMTGVNTVTLAAAGQPTFAEVVAFETALTADNADMGRLAYIMPAGPRGHLKTTPRFAGGEIPIWDNGQVNGYPAYASNLLTKFMFGNWSDLIMGFWGSMEIATDPYTKMTEALYRVVAIHETDVAARHPESFAKETV